MSLLLVFRSAARIKLLCIAVLLDDVPLRVVSHTAIPAAIKDHGDSGRHQGEPTPGAPTGSHR
jgi:hypothetical protein